MYKDDVEGQVKLSGDSASAIRNSPRLVAPSKQTTADYSRLNFCLVPGKLLLLLTLISNCAEAVLLSMKISLRLRPLPGGPVLPAAPRVPSGPWGTTTTLVKDQNKQKVVSIYKLHTHTHKVMFI